MQVLLIFKVIFLKSSCKIPFRIQNETTSDIELKSTFRALRPNCDRGPTVSAPDALKKKSRFSVVGSLTKLSSNIILPVITVLDRCSQYDALIRTWHVRDTAQNSWGRIKWRFNISVKSARSGALGHNP